MDRWIGTLALALLLALLLAPGAGAATLQAAPITTSTHLEIVLVDSGDSMIITDRGTDTYIIAYPTIPASKIEDEGTVALEIRDSAINEADYITIYPAVTGAAAKEAGGAVEERKAAFTQPAVPVLSLSRYYSQDVSSPDMTLWVDMRWEGDGDHALTVYHPGGLLGTFRDGSDGQEDGRIFLRFSREGGVGTGTWTFKMTAPLAASRENATIQTYIE
ncbi:hypothetical protein [uncultured Methanofollis sp.]|uniref:hypothetical protein n=1 Tax=uncultured Methanofollis sp. TaxID=262500 RepID=UPI002630E470|nr:hypothetical protein [uncultured Methanofollis sp.]